MWNRHLAWCKFGSVATLQITLSVAKLQITGSVAKLQINAPPSVPASLLCFSSTGNTAGVSRRQLTTGIVDHTPLALLSDRNSPQAPFNTHFHWWCFSWRAARLHCRLAVATGQSPGQLWSHMWDRPDLKRGDKSECWSHRWGRPDLKRVEPQVGQTGPKTGGTTGGTDRT